MNAEGDGGIGFSVLGSILWAFNSTDLVLRVRRQVVRILSIVLRDFKVTSPSLRANNSTA